jgi:hypothetical protein
MKKSQLLGAVGACIVTLLASVAANASIIYNVDRIIGDGTVTGFIETDGTLGVLGSGNITDWTLTLTAPNLYLGPTDVIDIADTAAAAQVVGTAVTATSTQLLFDFSLSGEHYALFIGGTPEQNSWCLETAAGNCTGNGIGEHISWDENNPFGNPGAAQSVAHTGLVVFAEVQTVPVPAAAWLFGSGLLGLVGMARRKKA